MCIVLSKYKKKMNARNIFIVLVAFASMLSLAVHAAYLQEEPEETVKLVIFYRDSCPHCHDELAWLGPLKEKYPTLVVEEYEAGSYMELFKKTCEEYNSSCVGVPTTFVGGKVFSGFVNSEGDLIYDQRSRAYIGYAGQIERTILDCLNHSCSIMGDKAIEVSKTMSLVSELIRNNPNVKANYKLVEHTYLVAWWTPERLSSKIYYPDVLVYVDGETGEVLKAVVPTEDVPGLDKPIQSMNWLQAGMFAGMGLYLLLYLVLRNRLKVSGRYWGAGFMALLIAFFFIFVMTLPEEGIRKFAEGFPFPVYVFIVALADGFNPCAFTVLVVLLSLLTHTRSKKKMALIGGIFILTSGFMYFLFILAMTTFLGLEFLAGYRDLFFRVIGVAVVAAAMINLKDYFFFKKGVSLGISDGNRNRIFRKAGKIVKGVDNASDKRSLLAALLATALLAAFVNLVEFGCTALLPTAYANSLFAKYGTSIGLYHVAYTAFYSLVYILPLIAILGNFIYSFKSERLSENQARTLKLAGGIVMLILGSLLAINPSLLSFG